MIDLADFEACLWEVASAPRHIVQWARAQAEAHPENAARIDTCQRIEVYGLGPCDCSAQKHLHGTDALVHLAEVAAGLHSAVLGETQVMGQVRGGLTFASDDLRQVGAVAVAAGRELRRIMSLDADVGSLLDQALRLAGVAPGGSILILGTGHQARATGRRAAALGFEEVVIAGRTEPPRMWLGHTRYRFRELRDLASESPPDVLVGCLGEAAGEFRPGEDVPLPGRFALDLGTPRNLVDVDVVRTITIAELLTADSATRSAERAALRSQLHSIVERRLAMAETDGRSPVGALRQSIEQSRRDQLDRLSRLHPDVPPQALDAITRTLLNQLFHAPSERLRALDDPELQEQVVALFAPATVEAYD
jgi:glutamyl-tRNA reductase